MSEGPSLRFPFEWPDAQAPTLHWRLQTRNGPLGPLQEDAALARRRTAANSAAIKGAETSERALPINGFVYAAQVPSPFTETDRHARKVAYEAAAAALVERGETYLEAVIFPELDATNARLAAVDVFTVPPAQLADHLLEALRWYERAWTLHSLRPPDDPRERFLKLYSELTGETGREAAGELIALEPNLMSDAVEGVIELARIAQRYAALGALVRSVPAQEVLPALDDVEGGAAFRAAFDGLLERQGLRCGEGAGNERDRMAPSWREDPSLVVALVQHYITQDLGALAKARAAAVARRDARVAELRACIEEPAQLAAFDFWLTAARRSLQRFEDHNYKIDSAAAALLRLAIVAAGRRLAAAGRIGDAEDVWWLHADEIALALCGLDPVQSSKFKVQSGESTNTEDGVGAATPGTQEARSGDHVDDEQPNHWRHLVAARAELHDWRTQLQAPETLGAPPSPGVDDRPGMGPRGAGTQGAGSGAERPQPPADALVAGQGGSGGVAAGRVRILDRHDVVPEVEKGDVLVARNASPLWAPIFPAATAVILDAGGFFQHAMLTCREYGIPAVFQTKDATQKLTAGQRVTVDGTNGWVLPASE